MKIKDIKRKNFKKKILFTIAMFFVIAMGIGYAYLRDTLTIEDNAKMSMTWNVYFDNAQKVGNSIDPKTPPVINKTNFSTTLQFTDTSQVYETIFDVKNDGSLNAAVNTFTSNPLPSELQSYFDVSFTYKDGITIANNQLLSSNSTDTFKLKISLKNGVDISELPESIPISLTVNYAKATSSAFERDRFKATYTTRQVAGEITTGDEICISSECFNVVKEDGDNIVMLAKYNLNVGMNSKENESFLQDIEADGSSSSSYGNVAFSASIYWNDIENYPADVYNNNFKTSPDFSNTCDNSTNCYYTSGYSIAYYVEEYKNILENMGITIQNARLLTFNEATADSIECVHDVSRSYCPTTGDSSFITNTSFWTGSAAGPNGLYYIGLNGAFSELGYNVSTGAGVRPVIVISKSDVE